MGRTFVIVYRDGGRLSAADIVAGNVVDAISLSGIFPDDIVSVSMVSVS